jgi:hypothetical protein
MTSDDADGGKNGLYVLPIANAGKTNISAI